MFWYVSEPPVSGVNLANACILQEGGFDSKAELSEGVSPKRVQSICAEIDPVPLDVFTVTLVSKSQNPERSGFAVELTSKERTSFVTSLGELPSGFVPPESWHPLTKRRQAIASGALNASCRFSMVNADNPSLALRVESGIVY